MRIFPDKKWLELPGASPSSLAPTKTRIISLNSDVPLTQSLIPQARLRLSSVFCSLPGTLVLRPKAELSFLVMRSAESHGQHEI